MPKRKHSFGLRIYPQIGNEFHAYVDEIRRNFIDEIHQFLKCIPKEPISEGGAEIIERLDGSRATITFDEVSVSSAIDYEVFIHGKFDEVILFIYRVADEMGGKMVQGVLKSAFETAEEYGHVRPAQELEIDEFCQMLERADLTFSDEGEMDLKFVIPPQLSDKFNQVFADSRVQAIIKRKRREYFAKKGD